METEAASGRAAYRDALYEALAGPDAAVRDADPLQLLARLTRGVTQPPDDDAAASLVEGLDVAAQEPSIDAAVDRAAARFGTPGRFREAVYFVRCLARDPEPALALLHARAYLEDAAVPPSFGDEAPVDESRRIARAIEQGLQGQQGRLAQRVVSQLLGRPASDHEERLRRFIEVVQASDLSGLALTLDDPLIEFLSTLLDAGEPQGGVLQCLAIAYPEVTPANVDAVISEFRRLVELELEKGAGSFA